MPKIQNKFQERLKFLSDIFYECIDEIGNEIVIDSNYQDGRSAASGEKQLITQIQVLMITEIRQIKSGQSGQDLTKFHKILNTLRQIQEQKDMGQFTFSIQFLIGAYMSIFESVSHQVEIREKALFRAAYILLLWVLGIEIPKALIVQNDHSKQILGDTDDHLYAKIKEPDFISAKNENNSNYGQNQLIQPKIENLSNDDSENENEGQIELVS